jgi:hypothetical protein
MRIGTSKEDEIGRSGSGKGKKGEETKKNRSLLSL